jgi:CRP/FNR family cyclic AMP-dependent transcriptional regulator
VKIEQTASLLAATPLLASLEPPELLAMAEQARQRIYPEGHFLFRQGEAGDALFVILSGSVRVTCVPPGAAEGARELVLATLRAPEVFGELALVDGGLRSASVQALESTRVLTLLRSTLLELMGRNPAVADRLLQSVGELVRRTVGVAPDLVFLDLPGRVAALLLGMVEAAETTPVDGMSLDFKTAQATLAAGMGASRQSVNRILGLLVQDACVEVDGRTLVVKDLEGLRRRARPARLVLPP